MLNKALLSAVCFFFIIETICGQTDYCNLRCGAQHTMCKYPNPGPGVACVGYSQGGLSAEEKALLLKCHNELRNKVATGGQEGQPSAADMQQMAWDSELELVAQRWSDQCLMEHDSCRISARFQVGQNLAFYGTTGKLNRTAVILKGCNSWFSEVKDMPVSEVSRFTNQGINGGVIGHYTQLVWAKSNLLGCGQSTYKKDAFTYSTLACNYGPAGNFLGSPVYQIGPACSNCPSGTSCSQTYSGLCSG